MSEREQTASDFFFNSAETDILASWNSPFFQAIVLNTNTMFWNIRFGITRRFYAFNLNVRIKNLYLIFILTAVIRYSFILERCVFRERCFCFDATQDSSRDETEAN